MITKYYLDSEVYIVDSNFSIVTGFGAAKVPPEV